jgi:hypothetical protein
MAICISGHIVHLIYPPEIPPAHNQPLIVVFESQFTHGQAPPGIAAPVPGDVVSVSSV